MDRVRTLGESGRKLGQGFRFVGQGKAATMAEAREVWRAWYNTSRWRKLRMAVLERDAFTCRYCDGVFSDTSQLVADHIVPHRGNAKLFWDEANLQCLCARDHSKVKQAEEAGGR